MFVGARGKAFRQGQPTVVFSHGFTVPGFESNRMFWKAAMQLSTGDWQSVLFDYRGSGYSDMEFESMTLQTEIQDLEAVLSAVRGRVGSAPLFVWGMSLGTSVAIEVLAEKASSVEGLILWGLSAELYERWSTRWVEDFQSKGFSILPSGFLVKPSVVEGMRGIDTYASLKRINVPIYCVAGAASTTGEARMSRIARDEATTNFEYVEYAEGEHGFKGQPQLLERAMRGTIDWLDTRTAKL
jgi:hypothetical protein